ncbi:MAG: phosphoenolpyruvate--protein phosphotransferase [Lachnospiraceae bacterium]
MVTKRGKSIVTGMGIGQIYLYRHKKYTPVCNYTEEVEKEITRFYHAQEIVSEKLKKLYERTFQHTGKEQAMIFDAHQMMLQDVQYTDSILNWMREKKVCAEYAVFQTADSFAKAFSGMEDSYMQERSADVLDISNQVIDVLIGREEHITFTEPVIFVAQDLTPSEIMEIDKSKVAGFVFQKGSSLSHTAILARAMNIPTLVHTEMELREEYQNKQAVVDGEKGVLYIQPDIEFLRMAEKCQEEEQRKRKERKQLIGTKSRTKSGKKVSLYANIGCAEDVESVLENDGEGIGLFRSEFLYMGRKQPPSEEEQFEIYRFIVQKMKGKKVVIRTFDLGADKKADYLHIEKEDNPAMGYRGIRICLKQPELLKEQLRAIYRASYYGTVSIMFPMIISVSEIHRIWDMAKKVQTELCFEQKPMGKVELGIMIETPAAVMISDLLAKEVDFFSIGTNDLTQYTLAVDRQNHHLDSLYDSHHEAIIRMIRMTVEHGHAQGIWVGICGELAADETLTQTFMQMGVDELSVAPACILKIREQIQAME